MSQTMRYLGFFDKPQTNLFLASDGDVMRSLPTTRTFIYEKSDGSIQFLAQNSAQSFTYLDWEDARASLSIDAKLTLLREPIYQAKPTYTYNPLPGAKKGSYDRRRN